MMNRVLLRRNIYCLYFMAITTTSAFVIPPPKRDMHTICSNKVPTFLEKRNKKLTSFRFKYDKTQLQMNFLQSFFFGDNNGGGSYFSKIDYEDLDHPGPELSQAAMKGQILTQSISKDSSSSSSSTVLEVATFAGGCFWGLELAFQRTPGVVYTIVGYTQGSETEPNYDQVSSGNTGHTEALCIYYDPNECTYQDMLDTFFQRVNPLTKNGQGNDFGRQYRTGVYYHTQEQEEIARKRFQKEQIKYQQQQQGQIIQTECKKAMPFWPAEKMHQQYLQKGGRFNNPQSASKGCTDEIKCYG